MPFNVNFGYGVQRLIDSNLQYTRVGFPVYLRLRNFPDLQNSQFAQMGFAISPSGTAVGTTDILIAPPPSVSMVSVHNIGMSEGKLRFGARTFLVSQAFVTAQVAAQSLSDQNLVWRGPNVVGLVTENLLFSIEDVNHGEVAGQTVSWVLTANANELR